MKNVEKTRYLKGMCVEKYNICAKNKEMEIIVVQKSAAVVAHLEVCEG